MDHQGVESERLPRWKRAIDRLLAPVAALVYGPRSEQPQGLAPRLVALVVVLLLAALAWIATHARPDSG